jgi:hypothetical protein
MNQRVLYKHALNIGSIKYPIELKPSPLNFEQWMKLTHRKRYELKKTYIKNNIEIPTQDYE